jgi:TRAP transporter TAXI family solute receptor
VKKEWFKIIIGFGIILFLALAFTYQFIDPAPPKTLKIATGTKTGSYFKFAKEYQEILKKENFNLQIIPSEGSVEALKGLEENKVDVAFVQGGVATSKDIDSLFSLGSIYFEPLWIFYKSKLNISYISDLKGKKIAIGSPGSGTKPLALSILSQNSINAANTKFLELSTDKAKEALEKGDIDALFCVISPKAKQILALLENPRVKLLNIKRASAYSKRFHYLTPLHLGEGVISLKKNIPTSNISLLSTTATLVAHKDLHPDLVRLLLKTAKKVHDKPSVFEESETFPTQKYTQIPINKNAKHYLEKGDSFLEKIFPFWIASTIDRLIIMFIPLITLLIPIIKGALPLYRWRIRSSIYKWYKILHKIDLRLESIDKKELPALRKEIEQMAEDIQKNSKVPLSYMGEYYDLRVHANLIINRIDKLMNQDT